MIKQSLNGAWVLDIPESNFLAVPATVPGSVYHDLLRNSLMDDPYYRDNEVKALKLMEYDFHYSRSFTVEEAMLQEDAVLLRCEGLDTIATILLNGQKIGYADNMHRTWEFDVKNSLHPGENRIEIQFSSPTKYAIIADANSIAVPSPRLVITLPSVTTSTISTVAPSKYASNPG